MLGLSTRSLKYNANCGRQLPEIVKAYSADRLMSLDMDILIYVPTLNVIDGPLCL